MKRLARVILLVLALAIFVVSPVLAATFTASITVVENAGNSYTNSQFSLPVDNQSLASGGYMLPSGLDMQVLAGATQLPSMIASDRTLFAASQASSSRSNYTYSFGNTPRANMDILTGYKGAATIPYTADLNPSQAVSPSVLGVNHNTATAVVAGDVDFPLIPGGVTGYLALVFMTYSSANSAYTTDSGWTVLYTNSSGVKTHFAMYKFLQADDSGTAVLFPASVNYSSTSYIISGATDFAVGAVATGTSTTPDAPSVSLGSANQSVNLIFASTGATSQVTTYPSNMTNGSTTAAGDGYWTATAYISGHASSTFNPNSFGASPSATWIAGTVAIFGYQAKPFKLTVEGNFQWDAAKVFPEVVGVTSVDDGTTVSGKHEVFCPLSEPTKPGDLIIVLTHISSSANTNFSLDDGTLLANQDAGTNILSIAALIATGLEGSSVRGTYTTTSTNPSAFVICQVWQVRNTTGVIYATAVNGSNPPALTPAFGNDNYLWIAASAATSNITSGPTNYTDLTVNNRGLVYIGTARRELKTTTQDPSNFNTGAVTGTIAIQGGTLIAGMSKVLGLYISDGNTLKIQLINEISPSIFTAAIPIDPGVQTLEILYQEGYLTVDSSAYIGPNLPTWAPNLGLRLSSANLIPSWSLLYQASAAYTTKYSYWLTDLAPLTELLVYQPNAIVVSSGLTGTLPNRATTHVGSYDATIVWGTNPAGITTTLGPIESTGTFVSTSAQPIGPDIAGNTSGGNVGGYDPNATTSGFGPLGPLFQAAVDSYNANAPGRQVTLTQVYQIMGLAIVVTAIGVVAYMTSMFFLLVIVGGILIVLCSIGVYPWAIFWVTCILMTGVWVLRIHMSPGGM